MWHSPRQETDAGKRYAPGAIAALLEPLELMLDALRTSVPAEVVTEPILKRMEADELEFALHEVFVALLEDAPVPPGGHAGYHEAIVAELLDQCCGLVELELSAPGGATAGDARRSAWRSFVAFCGERDAAGRPVFPLIEHLELIYDDPEVHLCPLLTADTWQAMLLDESAGVAAEFLWDYDWRLDTVMDRRPAHEAWLLAEDAGVDLDAAHRLPRQPRPAELAAARRHLRKLVAAHRRDGSPL